MKNLLLILAFLATLTTPASADTTAQPVSAALAATMAAKLATISRVCDARMLHALSSALRCYAVSNQLNACIFLAANAEAYRELKNAGRTTYPQIQTQLDKVRGQQSSFGIYEQQFIGPDAVQAALNVQSNLGNAGPLAELGIDFNEARKMTPGELAYAMLRSAVVAAQASPNLPFGNNPALEAYAALSGDADFDNLRTAIKIGLPALDQAHLDSNRNDTRMARINTDRSAVDVGIEKNALSLTELAPASLSSGQLVVAIYAQCSSYVVVH
jgi:hypothetical protein